MMLPPGTSNSEPLQGAPPELVNGSLRMLGDRILLKPLQWRPSAIIDVQSHRRPFSGIVLAVGPGRHPTRKRPHPIHHGQTLQTNRTRFQPTEVRVGDVVELGGLNIFDGKGYQFPEVIVNGEKCLIVTERDVCGVHTSETVKTFETLTP